AVMRADTVVVDPKTGGDHLRVAGRIERRRAKRRHRIRRVAELEGCRTPRTGAGNPYLERSRGRNIAGHRCRDAHRPPGEYGVWGHRHLEYAVDLHNRERVGLRGRSAARVVDLRDEYVGTRLRRPARKVPAAIQGDAGRKRPAGHAK